MSHPESILQRLKKFTQTSSVPVNKDAEPVNPEFSFIDETSGLNPFVIHDELQRYLSFTSSPFSEFTSFSNEGYAENPERQNELGKLISSVLRLQNRGDVLDVGWGTNHHIAQGILEQSGNQVFLLDIINTQDHSTRLEDDNPPFEGKPVENTFPRYFGDIADIANPASQLKDKKFGAVLFNGSWSAGANNFTIQEIADLELQARGFDNLSNHKLFSQHHDSRLRGIIKVVRDSLTHNGVVYFGSSRYAFHGGGYSFTQLPYEKLEFLDIIKNSLSLGARKITVIGVSSSGLKQMVDHNLANQEYQEYRARNLLLMLSLFDITSIRNQVLDDPKLREELLNSDPKIARKYRKAIEEDTANAHLLLRQLTEGVDALPDKEIYDQSLLTPEKIRIAKESTRHIIPKEVGRIDGVAIEF